MLRYLKKLPDFLTDGGPGLVLANSDEGSVGNGKGLLAAVIAKAAMVYDKAVLWTDTMDLTSRFKEGGEAVSEITAASLLVIDDITRPDPNSFMKTAVDYMLRRRVGVGTPTVVTAAMPVDDLGDVFGEETVGLLRNSFVEVGVPSAGGEGENRRRKNYEALGLEVPE